MSIKQQVFEVFKKYEGYSLSPRDVQRKLEKDGYKFHIDLIEHCIRQLPLIGNAQSKGIPRIHG